MGRTAEGLKTGIAKLKEIRKEFEKDLFIPGDKEGTVSYTHLVARCCSWCLSPESIRSYPTGHGLSRLSTASLSEAMICCTAPR